jgi:Spy/CpxP family protein refolding chaperone
MKTPLNKWLVLFAIALLIINGVLVYFLWKDKKPRGKERGNRGDWMVNELKFDEKQKAEHKKLKEAHFNQLKPLFDSINTARSRLYDLLKEPVTNDSLVNYYANMIGEKHKEMSLKTFDHFKKVRALCNPEQQKKLDEFVQKIVQNMGRRGKSPGPEKK